MRRRWPVGRGSTRISRLLCLISALRASRRSGVSPELRSHGPARDDLRAARRQPNDADHPAARGRGPPQRRDATAAARVRAGRFAARLPARAARTRAPRQRLAFLLWPDSTEAQARTNLRKVLHTLRRALPDADRFIEVTPTTLRWRADAPYRLDLDEFERALAADRLQEAVDAYAGDLSRAATTTGSWRSASGCATATSMRSSGSGAGSKSARSGRRRSAAPSGWLAPIRCARTRIGR